MEKGDQSAVPPAAPIESQPGNQDETNEEAQMPLPPAEATRAGGLAVPQSVEVDFGDRPDKNEPDEQPQPRRDPRTKGNPEDVIGLLERTARPQRESMLTLREQEVIALSAEGLGNKEIGKILGISSRTVKGHLQKIGVKLGGVGDRTAQVSNLYELRGAIPAAYTKEQFGLTDRVASIIELAAQGLSNAQIGTRLFISEHTVKTHVARALKTVGAKNRTHLVTIVYGLVEKPEDKQPTEPGERGVLNEQE